MSQAAEEYAIALFESLKSSEEKVNVLSFLRAVSEVLETQAGFYELLKSQTLTYKETKEIFNKLTEAVTCPEVLKNFFNVLIDNRRLDIIPLISDSFQKELDKENGILRGNVKSAYTLNSEKRKELEEKLAKKLGQKVILNYHEDKAVLAGLRVELEAYTLDDTVETHLKKIKENVNRSTN
jgi:ATP synthase F1 delta subunit